MREQHELSKAFPAMSDEEYQDLKDSIENIGVQNPIVIYEEKVIDGWHRYNAANDVGMPCPEVELEDDIDPRDFVIANNKARRHLTKSQIALSYTKVYQWHPIGKNPKSVETTDLKTSKDLAKMAGVGVSTIEKAKQVLTKGNKEVIDAVESGKIGINKGSKIASLPKEKQAKALSESEERKPSLLDGNAPSEEELMANELAMEADLKQVNAFLEADDKMAHLYEENKRLSHLLAQKEARIKAIMNEKSECIKICKRLQKENDMLRGKK